MKSRLPFFCVLFLLVATITADEKLESKTYRLEPSKDSLYQIQSRLIGAVPGDVIELSEGEFKLQRQIDIVADNITIRGRGADKTILNFEGQTTGSQGIEAIGNNFLIEGLTIRDTSGNAIKVLGARNVTFRDVRAEWLGEPKSTNGAYGLYPVQCENVLIENCATVGASDAGIYVGQCRNVIIRRSRAERNVAGIEVENTVGADVHDNVATNNAGGLLVFDLPGLQVKGGRNVRVFQNKVVKNNHRNFAAPGNIVASVPSGTGLMVMATDHVEIFDNEIDSNQTSNLSIVSYYISGKKFRDKDYDPIPEAVSVHDNRISNGGFNPSGNIRKLLVPVLGKRFPDILYDGFVNPQKLVKGSLPKELRHSIRNNGPATFVNFNLPAMTPRNVASGKHRVDRSLDPYQVDLQPLPKIELRPHDAPSSSGNPAVLVYRNAPQKLSEYGLFEGEISKQIPTQGTIPYDLNKNQASGSVEQRARAWLHVNCAHCHSPLGTARTSGLDLRLSQEDPMKLGIWKSPVAAGHGSGGHDYDIVPGKPHESILMHRLLSSDPSVMMPNVSKRLVPVEGAALVSRWIAEMRDLPR